MEQTLQQKIEVTELIPQQYPFIMVDKLLDIDEQFITTSLLVKDNNIFVENGFFTEAGIIENMAQTGAARMGYFNKFVNQGDVKLGFIGEIKNLQIIKLPCVGEVLNTTVEIKNEVLSTLLVYAAVQVGDEIVASCNMKICMTDIVSVA